MKPFSRVYWTAFLAAFGFLCLVAGFLTTVCEIFPYPLCRDALMGLKARQELMEEFANPYRTDMFAQPTSADVGVTRYDPERAYDGYTLFTSGGAESAFLIDMQGRLVHQWHLPYRAVWSGDSSVSNPVPERFIYWPKAELFPNGDLLAVYVAVGDTPWGYGLVKMDANSRPIWANLDRFHHDMTVGPDGRIYALAHRIKRHAVPELPDIQPPSLEDFVVVLSPDGKVLKKVSVYTAFARSRYRGVISILRSSVKGDTLHVNCVTPLPKSFKRVFPFAGPNTVLISSRNLDAIALLDLDSEKIIWVLRGPWARQHDPEFLANGRMLLFDNLGDLARGGRSRVLEFEPNPLKILWEYPGESGHRLFSAVRGATQELPNGNVLITETDGARLLEVTPDQKLVWEYRNPLRRGDHKQYAGVLCWAHRFGPHELTFLHRHTDAYLKQTGEARE